MKKIMMLLMIAVLMLGVSGTAMAAFEDGHLIRVVYSAEGINEIATDLGVISDWTSPSAQSRLYDTNNFDLALLGGSANASNTYVSYFALTGYNPVNGTYNRAWIMGPESGQYASKTGFSGFVSKTHTATGAYQVAQPGSTQVVYNMSNTDSFWMAVNGGGTNVGRYGTFIPDASGAVLLSDLATVGYVDQVLYYYGPNITGGGNLTGVKLADLRTNANGTTQLNPVPVPAAVYLFGSGLLGLVGLRRKMAA